MQTSAHVPLVSTFCSFLGVLETSHHQAHDYYHIFIILSLYMRLNSEYQTLNAMNFKTVFVSDCAC